MNSTEVCKSLLSDAGTYYVLQVGRVTERVWLQHPYMCTVTCIDNKHKITWHTLFQFALPRQTSATNKIYLQYSFVNILSNKLCTSQISSTYVHLHSVRFEHELVFSAVSFTFRQGNRTIRSCLPSLLLFPYLSYMDQRKKGRKSFLFHLTFDYLDVKPRYVMNGVLSAAKGINIILARTLWVRHSALWGEEGMSWHWWKPRLIQDCQVWQTVGLHHKHAIRLADVTIVIGIYASHRPLNAQYSIGDRHFHLLTFGFIGGGHFLISWAISTYSNSIRLHGERDLDWRIIIKRTLQKQFDCVDLLMRFRVTSYGLPVNITLL